MGAAAAFGASRCSRRPGLPRRGGTAARGRHEWLKTAPRTSGIPPALLPGARRAPAQPVHPQTCRAVRLVLPLSPAAWHRGAAGLAGPRAGGGPEFTGSAGGTRSPGSSCGASCATRNGRRAWEPGAAGGAAAGGVACGREGTAAVGVECCR